MQYQALQKHRGRSPDNLAKCLGMPAVNRNRVSRTKRSRISDVDLEEWLSSALLVTDKQLGSVVREVEEISKA